MKPFSTPLAIEGTKEQFERLVPKLLELGYVYDSSGIGPEADTLVTNAYGDTGMISYMIVPSNREYKRTVIPAGNEELVMALAAMTDGMEHVKDEWFVYVKTSWGPYLQGYLYKCFDSIFNNPYSFDPSRDATIRRGFVNNNDTFKKATKEQIINHFMREVTKTPEQPKIVNLVGYKLMKDLPFAKEGQLFTQEKDDPGYYNTNGGLYCDRVSKSTIQNTEWFGPVYEDKVETITLRCEGGTFEIQVSKKGIYYAPDNAYLSADGLRDLLAFYTHCNINYAKEGKGHGGSYKFSATHIDSGCKKDVPIGDWYNVIDAYNKIKNS